MCRVSDCRWIAAGRTYRIFSAYVFTSSGHGLSLNHRGLFSLSGEAQHQRVAGDDRSGTSYPGKAKLLTLPKIEKIFT